MIVQRGPYEALIGSNVPFGTKEHIPGAELTDETRDPRSENKIGAVMYRNVRTRRENAPGYGDDAIRMEDSAVPWENLKAHFQLASFPVERSLKSSSNIVSAPLSYSIIQILRVAQSYTIHSATSV